MPICYRPIARARPICPGGSSIRDRIALDGTDIDVPADVSGSVVEDGFEVDTTVARPAVNGDQDRTRRRQNSIAQEILAPASDADGGGVDFDDRHPRIVYEFDVPVQGGRGRSGRGFKHGQDRSRTNRGTPDLNHLRLRPRLGKDRAPTQASFVRSLSALAGASGCELPHSRANSLKFYRSGVIGPTKGSARSSPALRRRAIPERGQMPGASLDGRPEPRATRRDERPPPVTNRRATFPGCGPAAARARQVRRAFPALRAAWPRARDYLASTLRSVVAPRPRC